MMQAKNELHKEYYSSPLGQLVMVSDGESLVRLDFVCNAGTGLGSSATPLTDEPACAMEASQFTGDAILAQTKQWLDAYFAGCCPSLTPPLKPQGTPFQELVWALLLEIPYGATTTYGELARAVAERLGKERMSAQAVGQAVGHNPIAIIVPCHRVIGKKGQLTGYAGGLERKRVLLALEARP